MQLRGVVMAAGLAAAAAAPLGGAAAAGVARPPPPLRPLPTATPTAAPTPDNVVIGPTGDTPLPPGVTPLGDALKPTRSNAWIARLTSAAKARAAPGAGAVVYRFRTRAPYNGGPVGVLVRDAQQDAAGHLWLNVLLPARPNENWAWIRRNRALLTGTSYRVVVTLRTRRAKLLKAGATQFAWPVVIGAPKTPTPTGRFAVAERVRQEDPDGFIGSWALHLTAFSNVLDDFGGGPGTIGLHGRGGKSFADPLGSAASHGCLRMDNGVIAAVAKVAREGTPVTIRP
jgi:lipoprotein-anchoring transpeptidase ErfK/SrfK